MDDLREILKVALSGQNQHHLPVALAKFNARKDCIQLYFSVFVEKQEDVNKRAMAGLLMKNVFIEKAKGRRESLSLNIDDLGDRLLTMIETKEEPPFIHSTAATVIAVLIKLRPDHWPGTLFRLIRLVTQGHFQALTVIERVLEEDIAWDDHHVQSVDYAPLWTVLFALVENQNVRALALKIVNRLLEVDTEITMIIDQLLSQLSMCAQSTSTQDRRLVCACLAKLVQVVSPGRMQGSMAGIEAFMLTSLVDPDDSVSLEACEYWNAQVEAECVADGQITSLIPALIQKTVYPEDDADILDFKLDVHSVQSVHTIIHDQDQEQDPSEWTVRKCAALTIDMLSGQHPAIVFPLVLSGCEALCRQSDWRYPEAALMVLGAVALGCRSCIDTQHRALIERFIMINLSSQNQNPILLTMAAWCLGRYVYIFEPPVNPEPLLGMLRMPYVKTRKAACSALALLVDNELIVEFRDLLLTVEGCIGEYTLSTLPYLFDLVNSVLLTDSVRSSISYTSLIAKCLQFYERKVFSYSLLECVKTLAAYYPVDHVELMNVSLKFYHEADDDQDEDVNTLLIMIMGECQKRLSNNDTRFLDLLFACMNDQPMAVVLSELRNVKDSISPNRIIHIMNRITEYFDPPRVSDEVAGEALSAWVALLPSVGQVDHTIVVRRGLISLSSGLLLNHQSKSFYEKCAMAVGSTLAHAQFPKSDDIIGPCLGRLSRVLTGMDGARMSSNAIICHLQTTGQLSIFTSRWPVDVYRLAVHGREYEHVVARILVESGGIPDFQRWRQINNI